MAGEVLNEVPESPSITQRPGTERDLVDDRAAVGAHHDHPGPAAAHGRVREGRQRAPSASRGTAPRSRVHALVELLRIAVRGAQLDADQGGRRALRPDPRLVRGVDDHAVPLGEARGPAEDRDLDAEGRERVVEAERLEQRRGPGARRQHDRAAWRCGRPTSPRAITRPPSVTMRSASQCVSISAPRPPSGLRERKGGRGGIGEAGVRLVGGGADVGELAAGQDLAHFLGGLTTRVLMPIAAGAATLRCQPRRRSAGRPAARSRRARSRSRRPTISPKSRKTLRLSKASRDSGSLV